MAKDLKVKIGTEKEALWNKVKIELKIVIGRLEEDLIVNKEYLKLAEKKIKEEESKH